MTAVETSQLVGIISVYALFSLKIYVVINKDRFSKETFAAGTLWTAMYFFFLGFLRLLSFFEIMSLSDLRVISGWSSLIPLGAVLIHLFIIDGKRLTKENQVFDAKEEAKRKREYNKKI